jgi:hypothetical protein
MTFEFCMSLCRTIDNVAHVCTKDELRSDFAYPTQAGPLAGLALRHHPLSAAAGRLAALRCLPANSPAMGPNSFFEPQSCACF